MKCVLVKEHGGYEKLLFEEIEKPEEREGEALVRVLSCGINHLDIWVRKGVEGHKFPLPLIPGSDIAGVIEKAPLHSGFNEGDRVIVSPGVSCGKCSFCLRGEDSLCKEYGIFGESRDGGYAEYVSVPVENLIKMPENLSPEECSAIPLSGLTAYHMLVRRAEIKEGERVLIHSAGSGVSVYAIQIAKLFNAEIIATTSSKEKEKKALELGAKYVINYREKDFVQEIKNITERTGVDIVIEHSGGELFLKSLLCLRPGGRIVTCGTTSSPIVDIDLRRIFFRSLSIIGSTMGGRWEVLKVLELAKKGLIKPVINSVLPIKDVRQAHKIIEDRVVFGKVVLQVFNSF